MISKNNFSIKSFMDVKNDYPFYNTEISFVYIDKESQPFLDKVVDVKLIIYGNYLDNYKGYCNYELWVDDQFITEECHDNLTSFINGLIYVFNFI